MSTDILSNKIPLDYQEEMFNLKEISINELRNNIEIQEKIFEWIEWWKFHSFNEIFNKILKSNDNFSDTRFFIQYLISNEFILVGFLILQYNSNPKKCFTDRILLDWIIEPTFFSKNYKIFANWVQSNEFFNLIDYFCKIVRIEFSNIAYIFFEFPEISVIETFADLIGISADDFQKKEMPKSEWIYYRYLCDEKVLINEEIIEYRNTFHFMNYNQFFEKVIPPTDLYIRMQNALRIYQNISLNSSIPNKNQDFESFLKKIVETKEYYNLKKPLISEKMLKIKQERKMIWNKMLHSDIHNFATIYPNGIKDLIVLMKNNGIRFTAYKVHSKPFLVVLKKYHYSFILNLIESINTEGSWYDLLLDEKNQMDPQLMDLNFLINQLGDFIGICEFEIEPNNWILAGIATTFYRKPINHYSKQLFCGLIFLEIFRGYGIAEILALIGLQLCEIAGVIDIGYEEATIRNFATHRLVDKIGFNNYGLIQNQVFDITGFQDNFSFLVGFYRTYRLTSKLLDKLIDKTQNNEPLRKKYIQNMIVNENLIRIFKKLIKNKIILPLIE